MGSEREVLAVPGRLGGTWTPWVMYPCDAAANRGATVHEVRWPSDPMEVPDDERGDWVVDQVRPYLDNEAYPARRV